MSKLDRLGGTQERFEGTRAGRYIITAFILVTLVSIAVTILPRSAGIHKKLVPATQPYLNAIGMDQNWGVFAPDPRREVLELRARLGYVNGQTRTWRPPESDPFIGATHEYRWRKLVEFVTSENYKFTWKPMAAFISRQSKLGGRRPVSVLLERRTREILPPGHTPRFGPWQETAYYELSATSSVVN
jgi:hypothetical protein